MRKTKIDNRPEIGVFIQSVLMMRGLKRGVHFKVSRNQLWVVKNPLRGKLLSLLRNFYPEYSYYWEQPKILRWF